jgi:signal peptidase
MAISWRGWWQAAALAATVALLLPLATFLVAVWLLGWQLQHVESGSMSPTFPVGSLLITAQVDPSDVAVGMPIVFEDPREAGRLVTHRVVGFAPGAELAFMTRGDANLTNDAAPVPARLVRGRVLWHVAVLGTVLDWLQWPRSFLVLVLLPGALLLALELRGRAFGHRNATPSVDQPMADQPADANVSASASS